MGSMTGAKRPATRLQQVLFASIPVWSIGVFAFVPFGVYAWVSRRRRDWMVFGAYLAATIAVIAIGVAFSSGSAGAALGGLIVALIAVATVHTAVLFRPVPRPVLQAHRAR
jgi:hypothetical protein